MFGKIEFASYMSEMTYKRMREDGASRWHAFINAYVVGIKMLKL